ncbi:hypothetical protein J0A68_22365, partial [Algoriphagus sp. H41]
YLGAGGLEEVFFFFMIETVKNESKNYRFWAAYRRNYRRFSATAVWRNGGCSASYNSFVVGSSAVLRLNFCAKNPPLRQALFVTSNMRNSIFIFLILILTTLNSFACSCVGTETIKQAFKRSEIVFVGTVVSSQPYEQKQEPLGGGFIDIYYHNEVTFEVTGWFKGKSTTSQIIYTGVGGGDCGFHFEVGEQYIVYATKDGVYMELGNSKMQTNICDRTNKLSELTEDLTELGKLQKRNKK